MSMNAHHLYGGIFTYNKEKAKDIIDMQKIYRDKNGYIEYRNGQEYLSMTAHYNGSPREYQWIKPNGTTRGKRFHCAWIDLNLSKEIIETYVLPITCLYTKKEDYHVFDTRDRKYMSLDDVIDRLIKIRLIYGNIGNVSIADSEYGSFSLDMITADGFSVMIGD